MRTGRACTFAFMMLLFAAAAGAGTEPPPVWGHTRPLTPTAAHLLTEAAARAPAVRALLEALEQTDVVVYVTDQMSGASGEPNAYLQFLTCAGSLRYLLVRVERWDAMPPERMAWLGHELQHALEIAETPDVRDASSLARLYNRIGWEAVRGNFESDRARQMTRIVRAQLNQIP